MSETGSHGLEDQNLSDEDIVESLGIVGINPEHIPSLNKLATAWKLQADIGGLNKETVNSILHGFSVEATALMPSLKLKESDPRQFQIQNELSQLARAKHDIIDWAFRDKFTIEGTARDVPQKIPSGDDK